MRTALVVTFLALSSAACRADFVPAYGSGYFTGTITYNGASATAKEVMTSAGVTTGPMSILAREVYAVPTKLKASIDDAVKRLAAENGITFRSSTIQGGLNMSIAGLTGGLAGYNRASLGGPSYTATLTKSGTQYGLSFTCTVTLRATNVAFAVVYEPYSGIINADPALSTVQLNESSSVRCSTNLDWMGIVGSLIEDYVTGKVKDKVDAVISGVSSSALAAVIPHGPDFLGLYNTMPPGRYCVPKSCSEGGFDVGMYLKNNFATYFTGRNLTLSLGPFVAAKPAYGQSEPYNTSIESNVVSVDFSDPTTHLSMSIKDVRYYGYIWVCSLDDPRKQCLIP